MRFAGVAFLILCIFFTVAPVLEGASAQLGAASELQVRLLRYVPSLQKDLGGTPAGASSATLPANGHLALFLKEVPAFSSLPPGFQGVLRISGTSIALTGLRGLYNERGDFLITTTPAAIEGSSVSQPIVFPHIVEGGGYTTQIVLFSSGTTVSTESLQFTWR